MVDANNLPLGRVRGWGEQGLSHPRQGRRMAQADSAFVIFSATDCFTFLTTPLPCLGAISKWGERSTASVRRKVTLGDKEEGRACWVAIWRFQRFGKSNGYSAAESWPTRHPTRHAAAPLLRLAWG